MSEVLRQSTTRTVWVGPVLDASGVAVTTCVIGDFKLSKHGGAAAAFSGGASLNHSHTGNYLLTLSTTDSNTVGAATITLDKGTDSCKQKDLVIIEEIVYDALYAAGTLGPLTVANLDDIGAAAWDRLLSGHVTPGTFGYELVTYLTTLLGRLTATRAGYLDNLNVGGVVASQADVIAINESASRRVVLKTVGQYERPETGSTAYELELRSYDGDGAAVDADSTPTLTATGLVSGSLTANLSAASNPATGVYRWTYTVEDDAALEQIRFDASVTIVASNFTMSAYTQVADFVASTWTTTHASQLGAIFNKLPARDYLTGSDSASGSIEPDLIDLKDSVDLRAVPGDEMSLIDGAITKPKFDNTTAFALELEDIGETKVMRTGADDDTGKTLSDQMDALSGLISGSGSGGARSVDVTVTDGTDPIEGALVRLTKGAEYRLKVTDVNGQISFSVDDGTWIVSITAAMYSFTPVNLVVSANVSITYEMTPLVIPPPANPDFITAVLQLITIETSPDPDVTVYYRIREAPEGSGYGHEKSWSSIETDAGGNAFLTVLPGAGYEMTFGALDHEKYQFVIPSDAITGHTIDNLVYQK